MPLCSALIIIVLLLGIDAYPTCDHTHGEEKLKLCHLQMRRWYELKQDVYTKCCQDYTSRGRKDLCDACIARGEKYATYKVSPHEVNGPVPFRSMSNLPTFYNLEGRKQFKPIQWLKRTQKRY